MLSDAGIDVIALSRYIQARFDRQIVRFRARW